MKKITKKILCAFLSIAVIGSLGACKSNKNTENNSTASIGSEFLSSKIESNIESVSDVASVGDESSSVAQAGTNPDNNAGTVSKNNNPQGKGKADVPAELRGTTLTYMYWWDPKKQMEGEAIARFTKDTGIKVNTVVASYSDFQAELNKRILSGNAPDLVRQIGNEQWMVANLQPITNSGYDFSDPVWDKWIMDQYTFNGKCYAANLKNSAVLDVAVMYYNKKALKSAGMDGQDPYKIWKNNPKAWTWEKFWSLCDTFVKAKGNKAEYYGASFEYYSAYVRAIGGSLWNYEPSVGKYVNNSSKSETILGWQKSLEAIDKKWLSPEYNSASFDRSRILFMWSGPYAARKLDNRSKDLKSSNSLGVVPIPTDSKYNTLYELTAFGIPQGAKNAKAAPYYIRYVMDKSSYNWDNIYYSKEAKDVLDSIVSSGNFFYGHSELAVLKKDMYASGSSQAKTILDAYRGVIDDKVASENDKINALAK